MVIDFAPFRLDADDILGRSSSAIIIIIIIIIAMTMFMVLSS